jgi:hypothetical protein
MLKIVTVVAIVITAIAHPFVGEHAGKDRIDHGNGTYTTRLEAGPPKM